MFDLPPGNATTIQYAGWNNYLPARDLAFTMIAEIYRRDIHPAWDGDLINFTAVYLETPGNTFLSAANRGQISGILAVRRYDRRIQALPGAYDSAATAELARCFVVEHSRRQGIASLLFQEAERFCKASGFTTLYLHTHLFLPGALEFWTAMGFQVRLSANDPLQTVHLEKRLAST